MNKTLRSFEEWKRQIIAMARREHKIYLVPGDNHLERMYRAGDTPVHVFKTYCNKAAQELFYH